jgi:hypothetical protein
MNYLLAQKFIFYTFTIHSVWSTDGPHGEGGNKPWLAKVQFFFAIHEFHL